MKRGTTPEHIFTIPIDAESVKVVKVTYAQGGVPIITKRTEDVTLEENQVKVKLTQEDTMALDSKMHCDIQVRIVTNEGEAMASTPIKRSVGVLLDDEVL